MGINTPGNLWNAESLESLILYFAIFCFVYVNF